MRGLFIVALLAGCAAPVDEFRGVPGARASVDGSEFMIYRKGDQAQSVRTNVQYAPRIGPLAGRAAVAMQQVTGCRVKYLAGDAAILVGELSCPATPATDHPPCEVDAVLKGRRGYRLDVTRRC